VRYTPEVQHDPFDNCGFGLNALASPTGHCFARALEDEAGASAAEDDNFVSIIVRGESLVLCNFHIEHLEKADDDGPGREEDTGCESNPGSSTVHHPDPKNEEGKYDQDAQDPSYGLKLTKPEEKEISHRPTVNT